MGVSSYLEIHTTLLGWQLYGLIWRIFVSTGLVWFPIIIAIYRNWTQPYRSQDDKPAVTISTRRMAIDVFTIGLVMMFAATPLMPVNLHSIEFSGACSDKKYTGQKTGTTYDDMQMNLERNNTKIPLFWYLVLSIGSGVSKSMAYNVPCVASMREWDAMLRSASIQDPALRYEYSRFYTECYVPAKAKMRDPAWQDYTKSEWLRFVRENPQARQDQAYRSLNYIAPRFFLQTPGFYPPCPIPQECGVGGRARHGVPGWPVELPRDGDYSPEDRALADQGHKAGRPYCDEWWSGSGTTETGEPLSLAQKLVNAAAATDGTKLKTLAQQMKSKFSDTDQWDTNRQIIQALLRNGPPDWTGHDFGLNSTGDKAAAAAVATFSAPEIISQLTGFHTAMTVVREGAPMAQALILMTIYMLLPIYLVLAGFRLESLALLTAILIAIKCWPALWTVAQFIDENLFQAMYPDPNVLGGPSGYGLKRTLLDLLTTSLFVLFPLVLTWIMTWAGLSGARMVDEGVSNLSSTPKSIGGSAGAGATRKAGAMASKFATKGKG